MAERLTEQNKTGWALKLDDPQNEFEARQRLMSKFKLACEKLGKIEDIMEKLGIKFVEDLDDEIRSLRVDKYVYKKDRDTWQKACELACEHIAKVEWLSCPETDNISESENEIKTLTKQSLNFFYQQAKKEGEQK